MSGPPSRRRCSQLPAAMRKPFPRPARPLPSELVPTTLRSQWTKRAEDAAIQVSWISPAFPLHACRRPQLLQPPAPSCLTIDPAPLPKQSCAALADCDRGSVRSPSPTGGSRLDCVPVDVLRSSYRLALSVDAWLAGTKASAPSRFRLRTRWKGISQKVRRMVRAPMVATIRSVRRASLSILSRATQSRTGKCTTYSG
jgi:hypothetical protein